MAAVRWSLRLVALQAAALALLLAAVHSGLYGWLVAVPAAAALALLAVGRWRGRRVSARLAQALRFAARRRSMPVPDPAALLAFARPAAGLGEGPVTVEDAEGVVAVLDLDDPAGLLAASGPRLPAPARLVPAAGARPPGARLTVQLLACAVRPAGSGPVSASYRQLTEGAVPARRRVLLAVRLSRVDGGWPGDELRRALPGTVRRLCRRLERDGYACRPLGPDAARAALAELAPPGGTARERWSGLLLGDWSHTCLRTGGTVPETLVPRLLNAPTGLVAVAMVPDGGGADLAVRLADRSPAALVAAAAWVRQQVAAVGLDPHRPDGAQRDGLAATLPLALPPRGGPHPGPAEGGPDLGALPPDGLMLGRDRQGRPVTVRLFGPGPVRAVLLGGVPAAQVVTLRALALGARVAVQTARPEAWEPFLRALPADVIALVPPGPLALPDAGPDAPQLVVVDAPTAGPATAPWRASLVLREEPTADDLELLVRAELVIAQPLAPHAAELVGPVLGLAEGRREWLARIPAGMVGAVAHPGTGRAALRWALLSPTPLERRLTGAGERVAIG